MRVLADTNILISAMLWPHSRPAQALLCAANEHQLYLSDVNIFELRDVLRRKAPQALADVDVFLAELPFELIIAPASPEKLIADPKDQPILNAAILADVDYIISGDKHFLQLQMEHPKPITAAEFLALMEAE